MPSHSDYEQALKRIEELTAELERCRYKGCGSYPRAIGEIEAALGITGAVPLHETVEAVRKLVSDLATERAAREQAEKRAQILETCHAPNLRVQAAETALAAANERVKELEGKWGRRKEYTAEWVRRCTAAETALASAREHARIALAYLDDKEDVESTPLHAIGHARTELRALLASPPSPAPVAATCAKTYDDPCSYAPGCECAPCYAKREICEAEKCARKSSRAVPCAGCASALARMKELEMMLSFKARSVAETAPVALPSVVIPTENQAWSVLDRFFGSHENDAENRSDDAHVEAYAAYRVIAESRDP